MREAIILAPKTLYFVGTAGSGKSTLTDAFSKWLKNEDYDSITVNLDPGCDSLPYEPDVDVRDWIRMSEIMEEYSLGPNGAQILAADMLALNIGEVADVIDEFSTDYVLVDTPGQLELFAFRQSSKTVVEALGLERSALVYLFDPVLSRNPNGFVTSLLLSSTVHFRLPLPLIPVLAKADLLSETDASMLKMWSGNLEALWSALCDESIDAQTQISLELLQAIDILGSTTELSLMSAETWEGLVDLYTAAQGALEGGEDIER
ncbi:MAG: ATP/GTP-binding protein [Thermoplasmata archaeon]|nr:ATP/GTP-binding protein [Thermoplasmata archaeon]